MADTNNTDRAKWKFNALYADTEVRSAADGKLLAVVHAGPEQARIVSLLKGAPQHNAALADGWMPIGTVPNGVRVLLGPRHAPVVGIAHHQPHWADDQEPQVNVVHYNGTVLVAGYHCIEWHALPAPPTLNASKEGSHG